ncbi:hypothetical protein GCM10009665_20630 [Kitasatospora nipponensis]|uniref:Uncharacterized protein n=1 Tax=Kitasatospora nipponensis TaxID=258049 RepID=A0ABP4GME8_9ACTN
MVLAVCIVVTTPGSTGSPGTTGGSGGSGGGGTTVCTWQGVDYPCYDGDLGWFNTADGCYYNQLNPQPSAGDPSWQGHQYGIGAIYLQVCYNAATTTTTDIWLAKDPSVGAPPPTPAEVAQMAIRKLQFARPLPHSAPADKALVGVPVWFWYETSEATKAQTVGPQTQRVDLFPVSVSATATLQSVVWDLGYQVDGKEATLTCTGNGGAGLPYDPKLGTTVPPGACTAVFGKASPPVSGSPAPSTPTPSASASGTAAATDGYFLTVTQYWKIHTVDLNNPTAATPPWPDLSLQVSSAPLGLQVSELQVLN